MKIVLLTNNTALADAFRKNIIKGCRLMSDCNQKQAVLDTLSQLNEAGDFPEVLLVTEGVDPSNPLPTWELLLEIKRKYNGLRIIYCAGAVENGDIARMSILSRLVDAGIYDLVVGARINEKVLQDALDQPKTFDDVSLYRQVVQDSPKSSLDRNGEPNVILVSSMKPGSGKTFLATNLAIAIARYGQDKRLSNGHLVPPRVAIVDGDLLNLSVGTMLRVNDADHNMVSALTRIQRVVEPDGSYSLSDEAMDDMKRFVRSCLTVHKQINNLYCMVAPQTNLELLSTLSSSQFYFMMDCLVKAFDVIICDSNSSFEHQTTSALFEMAGRIYMMCDMDYNNICNAIRYNKKLQTMQYRNKLHYIINKDLPYDVQANCVKDLAYSAEELAKGGIVADHRIPIIPVGKMRALDYNAQPLVMSLDGSLSLARKAVLDIANDIWKIDYEKMRADDEARKSKGEGLLSKIIKK